MNVTAFKHRTNITIVFKIFKFYCRNLNTIVVLLRTALLERITTKTLQVSDTRRRCEYNSIRFLIY